MRKKTVNSGSGLYAILGDPISQALSPVIMNCSFDRLNMDCVYLAFRANLENFQQTFETLKNVGMLGLGVTMPNKAIAAKLADRLVDQAKLTGVVNCLAMQDGEWVGYNTDSIGFGTAILEKRHGRVPDKMFILGAGGMAKAAIAQIALMGAKKITVVNRLSEKTLVAAYEEFAGRLRMEKPELELHLIDWQPELWKPALADADLVGNATANGMYDKGDLEQTFPFESVGKNALFFDSVYKPLETRFLRKARENGYQTVDGLELLAQQGICSFKILTNREVDASVMKADALNFLAAQS